MGLLKADMINGAYSQIRISGITSQPTPEDLTLALGKMEQMAAEYEGRNICLSYNLQDNPDPNESHNVSKKHEYAFQSCLAFRLLDDFGKEVPATLLSAYQGAYSYLSATTAPVRQTQYPSRQPLGAGNTLRWARYRRFYQPQSQVPLSCESNIMFLGDIDNFTEHFDSWLLDTEAVASFVITSDEGLTVVSSSLSSPDITYQISATGNEGVRSNSLLQVKIVATSDAGRVTTRIINFELKDSSIEGD